MQMYDVYCPKNSVLPFILTTVTQWLLFDMTAKKHTQMHCTTTSEVSAYRETTHTQTIKHHLYILVGGMFISVPLKS
jgi:hypothetical protein